MDAGTAYVRRVHEPWELELGVMHSPATASLSLPTQEARILHKPARVEPRPQTKGLGVIVVALDKAITTPNSPRPPYRPEPILALGPALCRLARSHWTNDPAVSNTPSQTATIIDSSCETPVRKLVARHVGVDAHI